MLGRTTKGVLKSLTQKKPLRFIHSSAISHMSSHTNHSHEIIENLTIENCQLTEKLSNAKSLLSQIIKYHQKVLDPQYLQAYDMFKRKELSDLTGHLEKTFKKTQQNVHEFNTEVDEIEQELLNHEEKAKEERKKIIDKIFKSLEELSEMRNDLNRLDQMDVSSTEVESAIENIRQKYRK